MHLQQQQQQQYNLWTEINQFVQWKQSGHIHAGRRRSSKTSRSSIDAIRPEALKTFPFFLLFFFIYYNKFQYFEIIPSKKESKCVRFIIGNLKLKLTDAINHCSHVFEILFYSQYVDFKCIHQILDEGDTHIWQHFHTRLSCPGHSEISRGSQIHDNRGNDLLKIIKCDMATNKLQLLK